MPALVPSARAGVGKCQAAINREYGRYLKARAKTVLKCQDSAVRNASPASPTDCPTTADDAKLAALEQRLRDRIAASCGGVDKTADKAFELRFRSMAEYGRYGKSRGGF